MRYSEEQIRTADSTDLTAYLESRGYELKREGRQVKLAEHESLYIKGNQWYWFSQRKGGKAISFLTEYEGMSFVEAMKILTGEEPISDKPLPKAKPIERPAVKELMLPDPAENNNAVFAYLKSRGIDARIIKRCIDEGSIFQTNMFYLRKEDGSYEKKYCPPQVVFVGKDKDGIAKYACTRSCKGNEKHDAYGSDKAYAFAVPQTGSKSVWVFESAVDLLSHMTLCGYSRNDYSTYRISLGGISPVALQQFLTDHPEVRYVNLALDADEQDREATKSITEFLGDRYKVYDHPPMNGKDYNEDLLYRQEQFRQKRRSSDIER